LGVTPHVAQNERGRRSAIERRTTRHPGYTQSQRRRKIVEEVFGWIKTVGAGGKLRYLGRARNKLWFELTAAAYNLTRLTNLKAAAAYLKHVGAASGVGTAVSIPPSHLQDLQSNAAQPALTHRRWPGLAPIIRSSAAC